VSTDERRTLALIAADLIRCGNPKPREISDALGIPYATYLHLIEDDDEFARVVNEARRERTDALVAAARGGLDTLISGAEETTNEQGENTCGKFRRTTVRKQAPSYRAISLVLSTLDPEFSAAASAPKTGAISFDFSESVLTGKETPAQDEKDD